jgi:hypothetical protein
MSYLNDNYLEHMDSHDARTCVPPNKCCCRNTKRVAEVWLGDHKRFFYEAQPNAKTLDAGRSVSAETPIILLTLLCRIKP